MSASTSPPTSGSSWTQKAINLTLTLGKGTFGQTGQNTVKLSNLRMVVTVSKSGFPAMDRAEARVYGVPPDIMNAVSTLGIPLTMWRIGNAMLIEAGDDTNGMAVVYNGYLHQAYQNFDEIPETSLTLVGWGGQAQAIVPTDAVSYKGTTDVAAAFSAIAKKQGWTFENNGVSVKVSNLYLWGTPVQQAHDLARTAGVEVYLDTGKSPITLAIWPRYRTRGGTIPLINAASGLIGYPKFQSNGMTFRCLFNPNISLGGQIRMESSVGGAPTTIPASSLGVIPGAPATAPTAQTGGPNGEWYVISPLTYELASQMPGGPWFCNVNCARTNILAASS